MGMEAAQAMSALGPTAACLVLGLFPPAGAGHGSLFCCQKWAWRLLRPCQRSVPQPLVLFLGFSRRQALVIVARFLLKIRHGGCSGHVSARFQSRFSCIGVYVFLPIGAVHGTELIPKRSGRILLRATERHDTGALAVPRDNSILLALVIVRQSLCRAVNRGWGWTAGCRSPYQPLRHFQRCATSTPAFILSHNDTLLIGFWSVFCLSFFVFNLSPWQKT